MARTRGLGSRERGEKDVDEDADEDADQENEEEEVTEQKEENTTRRSGRKRVWWRAEGCCGGPLPPGTGGRGCRPSHGVSPASVIARSRGRVNPSPRVARFL